MELKKILLLIPFTLFFFGNCQACEHGELNEENSCLRILRKFSGLFTAIFDDSIGALPRHHYERIDYNESYEIEGFATIESQHIDILPNELLYQVAVLLTPPDIISLIKSKNFPCLRKNNFWIYYNRENNYHSWNEELPAIKIAFSYYWFRNNKVRKAAAIGLPRARELLKHQENHTQENSPKSYKISEYSEKNPYEEYIQRKLFKYKY